MSVAPSTAFDGSAQAGAPSARESFRPEIQALRALAVLAVLVYHLVPTRFTGGFVGVDIFFVISGFLITGHLVKELERDGRIGVGAFWARRAKRLLPAAMLVLGFVALATLALPRLLWEQYFQEVVASTLYVENWRLAQDSVDYLAAANQPSPVQHYWSLSVEEQFYIALPLILLAAWWFTRRRRGQVRNAVVAVLAITVVGSFVYSVALTPLNPGVAYFSTATRAWEFALGGLLVFAPRVPSLAARTAAAAAGLAAIAFACVAFSSRTPFPGSAAAVPVLGTAAVIWAGTLPWRLGPSALGRLWPVATLGRVSYSLYLWHWPLIVIVPLVTGHRIGIVEIAGIAIASALLAWASTTFVEDPVRFSPRLLGHGRRPRTVALWSASAMASIVVFSLVALNSAHAYADVARADVEAARTGDLTCLGAMVHDDSCADPAPPATLVPDPVLAPDDSGNDGDCWVTKTAADPLFCHVGPADGTRRVLAVGDSHNNALIPAYRYAAEALGWQIDVTGHSACYWTDATLIQPVKAHEHACAAWQDNLASYLADHEPYDAILVTNSRVNEPVAVPTGSSEEETAVRGLLEAWAPQLARGVEIVALEDVPLPRADVTQCVVRHASTAAARCATPVDTALAPPSYAALAAEGTDGVSVLDLNDLLCDASSCAAVVGGVVVWQDRGHVTGTFARTLGPFLAERLGALVT
jgi:peptidoglycan/LPS O-acetylase OafA/YrhL